MIRSGLAARRATFLDHVLNGLMVFAQRRGEAQQRQPLTAEPAIPRFMEQRLPDSTDIHAVTGPAAQVPG